MTEEELRFTRSSTFEERIHSLILEVDIKNKPLMSVANVGGEWKVSLKSDDGWVDISWDNFMRLVEKLRDFVVEENEIMNRERESRDSGDA